MSMQEVCYSGTEVQFDADMDEIVRRMLLYIDDDLSLPTGKTLSEEPHARGNYVKEMMNTMRSLWTFRFNTRARTYQPAGPVARDYGT